jgi:SAM domain (Sterile alpha motif)
MRPPSKESESRTSTSTPFGNLRNNLNATDYEGRGNLNINEEVHGFLDSLKLNKYAKVFSDNGIEDMETLLELNEEYLTELNFPLGHKLKILKKIKEIKSKREVEEEEKKPIYDVNNMLPPRVEQAEQVQYEVLPYDEPSPEKPVAKKKVTICTPTSVGDDNLISDLLSGEYDEEKMRLEFRAALSNWRGDSISQPLEEVKEVEEFPNEDEGCGVGTSVADAQIGTDTKQKSLMVTTNVQHRGGNVHEVTNYGPIENPRILKHDFILPKKISCWN